MAFKLKNKGIKKIVGELRKASKLHAGQADKLEKMQADSPARKTLKPCQKAAAKRKFKVYPSAYANMWASNYKC
jgi:hypothetical protein